MLFKWTSCDNQSKFSPVYLGLWILFGSLFSKFFRSDKKDALISSVGELIIFLAAGVYFIEPEGHSGSGPLRSPPPCLPNHFGRMKSAEFVDLIDWFCPRLDKVFYSRFIEILEAEQRELRLVYQREAVMQAVLDGFQESIGFLEA